MLGIGLEGREVGREEGKEREEGRKGEREKGWRMEQREQQREGWVRITSMLREENDTYPMVFEKGYFYWPFSKK